MNAVYDPSPQEAADELVLLTCCQCPDVYTGRGLHAPDCHSDYRTEVITLARAAGCRVPG